MKEIYYYIVFGVILYFLLTIFFDNYNLEFEHFDSSLVPVSSIITLAKIAQKIVNNNGTLIVPGPVKIGNNSNIGSLLVTGDTKVTGSLDMRDLKADDIEIYGPVKLINLEIDKPDSSTILKSDLNLKGGLGSGNLIVDGQTEFITDLNIVAGNSTKPGNIILNGSLEVKKDTTINNGLNVTELSTLNGLTNTGNLIVSTDATLGAITINSNNDITLGNNLTVTGLVNIPTIISNANPTTIRSSVNNIQTTTKTLVVNKTAKLGAFNIPDNTLSTNNSRVKISTITDNGKVHINNNHSLDINNGSLVVNGNLSINGKNIRELYNKIIIDSVTDEVRGMNGGSFNNPSEKIRVQNLANINFNNNIYTLSEPSEPKRTETWGGALTISRYKYYCGHIDKLMNKVRTVERRIPGYDDKFIKIYEKTGYSIDCSSN